MHIDPLVSTQGHLEGSATNHRAMSQMVCVCNYQSGLKKGVGSVLPQAEAERPPRARGTWSGVGRRGAELPTPLCLRSSASSSYLYLALVSVPGSVSPGAPAAVFVSPSSPGSPCSFSASE